MIKNKTYKLSAHPSVTIAIPTLNEEEYIENVVRTFVNDPYEGKIEILVADGGSDDQTRKIVREISTECENVQLLDNPHKNQVFAFNIMLKKAQGELFMLAGAHAIYPDNYISSCVKLIKNTEALNVGGATRLAAKTHVQAGILFATYSLLGNGGANHKKINYSGYTDTLFPGFYIKEALNDVGGFNVENISNQDSEINLRLSKMKSPAHYISGDIKVYYFPRSTFIALLKQYFRYGRGRCITTLRHPFKAPLRAYLSFLLIWILIGIVGYLFFKSAYLVFIAIVASLLSIVLIDSFATFISLKKNLEPDFWKGEPDKKPGFIKMALEAIPAVLILHIGMWSGFTFQLIKNVLRLKNKW